MQITSNSRAAVRQCAKCGRDIVRFYLATNSALFNERVHCTTYQIPLICKVRVGGVSVVLGRAGDVLGAARRQSPVAALLAPEAHLLQHAVNLQRSISKCPSSRCFVRSSATRR